MGLFGNFKIRYNHDITHTPEWFEKITKIFGNLDEDKKIKVYGPKYSSFIFHPNMIHKANFARTKKRDVISINLHHLPK